MGICVFGPFDSRFPIAAALIVVRLLVVKASSQVDPSKFDGLCVSRADARRTVVVYNRLDAAVIKIGKDISRSLMHSCVVHKFYSPRCSSKRL